MSVLSHRIFKFRHRYVLTRSNGLRLRYIATFAAFGVAALGSLFLPATSSMALSGALKIASVEPAVGSDGVVLASLSQNGHVPDAHKNQLSNSMRHASELLKKAEAEPPYREVTIGSGDTVAGVLQKAGLSGKESYHAVQALSEHFDPRKVRAGQEIGLYFKPDSQSGEMTFDKMSFKLSSVKEIVVQKVGPEEFTASLDEKELIKRTYGRMAEIETSLYGSAARANIPSGIVAELIRIYSWDIDFQRDIRSGDKVKVLYEAYETEDGDLAKFGDILHASLSVGGKEIPIYRFEMDDGRVDYFEPDGTSVRKTLMKTPVDGARISSGFGMRRHPVLGYNKMHKGMDFAASTGTPIYAAGDGVIEFMGRNGGYGNYVRLRHNSRLKTAYAHMNKFKKGLGTGKRVEQGDIIGYVGTSGRSTGPHLHYEVLVNGTQVNPRDVNLPTGEILAGAELKKFKSFVKGLNRQYVSLTKGLKFAGFGDPDNG